MYKDIQISDNAVMELLAKGPVGAAEMFSKSISNFLTAIALEPENQFRKTTLLPNREIAIFGKTVAFAGFIEEQGRGSLHMHCVIWLADLSPKLLQAVGGIKALTDIVALLIDSIFKAEISPAAHVQSLLSQFTFENVPRASYYETHDPATELEEFLKDVERTIVCAGIHSHNGTCRKTKFGLVGCRMGKPCTCKDETDATQNKTIEEGNTINFEVFPNIELGPTRHSTDSENFEKDPLGIQDYRLLMWESKRNDIIVDIERMLKEDGTESRKLVFNNSDIPYEFPAKIQATLDAFTDDELKD